MDTDWTRLEAVVHVEDYSPIVHISYGLGVADDVIDCIGTCVGGH